jgi:hypothetical protein
MFDHQDIMYLFHLRKNHLEIEVGSRVNPMMDKVKLITRTDSVHKGINLPQKYTGKNTITGIIDVGRVIIDW